MIAVLSRNNNNNLQPRNGKLIYVSSRIWTEYHKKEGRGCANTVYSLKSGHWRLSTIQYAAYCTKLHYSLPQVGLLLTATYYGIRLVFTSPTYVSHTSLYTCKIQEILDFIFLNFEFYTTDAFLHTWTAGYLYTNGSLIKQIFLQKIRLMAVNFACKYSCFSYWK